MSAVLPVPLVWTCDGDHVCGYLHVPTHRSDTLVVLVAGGTQTRVGAHRMLVTLATALAGSGYLALRFDVRGRGDSAGAYPGFEHLDADLVAAIAAARLARPDIREIILLGHCDGAAASCFAAGRGLQADGLILLNPWIRTAETKAASERQQNKKKLFELNSWKKLFTGKLSLSSLRKSVFPDNFNNFHSPLIVLWHTAWNQLKCQTLVLTGSRDASGQEFLTALPTFPPHPALAHVTIPDGDHSFSTPAQTTALHGAIIAWLATHHNKQV
jgi:uncharacterized protein